MVMLYKEGSRSHEIPEEKIFCGSLIECFTADRAPLYVALEKDLEKYYLQRQACWQHARHYLVDAFVSDHRVLVLIQLINALFLIEREFKARGAQRRAAISIPIGIQCFDSGQDNEPTEEDKS